MRLFNKIIAAALCLLTWGLLIACDNPVGLGSKVNTKVPVISIPDEGVSRPGSFLQGANNIIYLDVEQEFGIDEVYMILDYYDFYGNKRTETIPAFWDSEKGCYAVNIDTIELEMGEGVVITQVTAIDSSGKKTVTIDMVYNVKNKPPQIEMTLPRINGADFDVPDIAATPQVIIQGNDLMGIATDLLGIEAGYPQIMMWYEGYAGTLDADDALAGSSREWGQWKTMVNEKYLPLDTDGLKAVQFRWPLYRLQPDGKGGFRTVTLAESANSDNFLPVAVDGENRIYRFKMRVMDKFGVVNVYPYRLDYSLGVNPPPPPHPNAHIAIRLAVATNPIIKVAQPPRYYNCTAPFEVHLAIVTGGTIRSIVAGLSTNEEFNFDVPETHPGILAYYEPGNPAAGITDEPGVNAFKISIPAVKMWSTPGEYMLHIQALDGEGKPGANYISFIVDTEKPKLQYIEPAGLAPDKPLAGIPSVTSTVFYRGIAEDNQRVAKLYYALGKTEVLAASPGLDPDAPGFAAGWVDTMLDDQYAAKPAAHAYPSGAWGAGGTVRAAWSGSLSSWQLRFENIADLVRFPAQAQPVTGNYFVEDYDAAYNLWVLPLKFKVVDVAKNVHIEEVKVIVDPDADLPAVELISHKGGEIVGGEVRINGTATDNEMIQRVELRVFKNAKSAVPEYVPLPGGTIASTDAGGNWYEAEYPGSNKSSTISWFYNLNTNGALNPAPEAGDINVRIDLRAWDATIYNPGQAKSYGRVLQLFLDFSNTVPRITKMEIIRGTHPNYQTAPREDYEQGARVSGRLTVVATVEDDLGLTGIRWKTGTGTYNEIINNTSQGSGASPWVVKKGFAPGYEAWGNKYEVYIPLDTVTMQGGFYNNFAGIYSMDIQAADNNEPVQSANNSYSLQIDNYYPFGNYSGYLNAAGAEFNIMGTAWDTGTGISVQEVKMVVVYFTRGSTGVSLWENHPTYSSTRPAQWVTLGQEARTGRAGTETTVTAEGVLTTLQFFPDVKQADGSFRTSYSGIVIDGNGGITVGGVANTYYQNFDGSPGNKNWLARIDTNNLKPGPVTLNYVVFDSAGNATHNSKDIYIANNRPVITNIRLGTDIDGNAVVTGGEDDSRNEYKLFTAPALEDLAALEFASGGLPADTRTGFKVRNSRFSVKLETKPGSGNESGTENNYRVYYATRSEVSASAITKGRVYTIKDPGNIQWINYGVFASPENYVGSTFVATTNYLGAGTGTLYYYDTTDGIAGTPESAGGSTILFNPALFSGTTPTAGRIQDGPDRFFLAKVYDSTVKPVVEANELSHVVLLNVEIDNTDNTAPTIDIAPFGRKYINSENDADKGSPIDAGAYTENIVTTTGPDKKTVKHGYVEYELHSGGSANISGKVLFLGKIADNQRISRISAQIPGYNGGNGAGQEFNIGVWNDVAGKIMHADYNPAAPLAGHTIPNIVSAATQAAAWGFEAVDEHLTIDYGHALNVKFAWDSSWISGVAQTGVTITFRVYDYRPAQPNPSDVTLSKTVNVVPYISEVVTALSGAYTPNPAAFDRSALGRYPVRENEVIRIKGFNLYRAANTAVFIGTTALAVSGTALAIQTAPTAEYPEITAPTSDSIYASIGTASSGYLVVRLNDAINSINNTNNKTAPYNQESNGLNNRILDDDRYLYVWSTGYLMNQYAGLVRNPFFRMGVNGQRYMTFGTYDSSGRWRVLVDNSYAGNSAAGNPPNNHIENAANRFLNLTLAVDQAGDWYAGASNMTSGTNYSFNFFARTQGAASGNSDASGTNKRRILLLNNNGIVNENRVRTPRIAAYNTNGSTPNNNGFSGGTRGADSAITRIFMSYYDSNSSDNPVVFRYGGVGANNSFGGDLGYTNNATHTTAGGGTSTWGSFPQANMETFRQIVAHNTSSPYRSGDYTAVGGLSNGRPVIAWYDNYGQKLVFSYGNGITGGTAIGSTGSNTAGGANGNNAYSYTSTTQWQNNAVTVDTFRGAHVDLAVDGSDNVHLAYYDSGNGGLYYAYIPYNPGSGIPDTGAIETVRVDTYLAVGTKLMINVRREGSHDVPYISYYHGSFTETRNAVRIAWRKDFSGGAKPVPHGTNTDDSFTGRWEVMTVPAREAPLTNEFITNGVPNPGTAQGSWADPNLSNGVAGVPALTRGSVDLRRSVVVGYMTRDYYEGAMLKGDASQ